MLPYVIFGATYAFAAAVQPGPFQAYLVSQTIANGWRRTLPAALAPLLSDIPIIGLALLVLTQVPPLFARLLQLVGGLFLLYLAAGAFSAWRNYRQAVAVAPAAAHRTLGKAVLVNLLNPNPYLSWTLVMGPLLLQAWRQSPPAGVALLAAFYLTMVTASAVIVMLFALTRSLGPRVARALVGLSAAALAAFGLYQILAGSRALL